MHKHLTKELLMLQEGDWSNIMYMPTKLILHILHPYSCQRQGGGKIVKGDSEMYNQNNEHEHITNPRQTCTPHLLRGLVLLGNLRCLGDHLLLVLLHHLLSKLVDLPLIQPLLLDAWSWKTEREMA